MPPAAPRAKTNSRKSRKEMKMAANVESGRRGGIPWRLIGWGIAATLILLPLIAMQFTSEVDWTASDFIFAIVLIGTVGLVFELAVRMTSNWAYRGGVACALAAAFFLVWINGAVGMIGDEDNAYNLLFLCEIPIALLGAIVARFRASGMAMAMFAAGAVHILLGALAALGLGGPAETHEVVLTLLFASPWLLSGGLLRKAAESPQPA
jgi:hypothetical protein